MEKLKANQADDEVEETQVEDEEEEVVREQARAGSAHVEPEGNCRPPTLNVNANPNGNPFKRPMNALQKQWYRVLLARRVGFGQREPQDEKEVT